MASYFKRVVDLTDEEKRTVSEMTGKIQLWVLEGRSLGYMSEQLNLPPHMILENIYETAYEFINVIRPRHYLKWLFHKKRKH